MNNQIIVLAFKDFWLILKNKMATIADSLITTVFKAFQEKLTIIRGCFTNCICSLCACVWAVTAVFLFHLLIFHNTNSFNKPLSVDTLCIWSQMLLRSSLSLGVNTTLIPLQISISSLTIIVSP